MITVTIRNLKLEINKLIRVVHETGEKVQITYRGEIVALLIPPKKSDTAWLKLDQLAEEIGAHWHMSESAASAVSESRRG